MFDFFKKRPSKLDESISLARNLLDTRICMGLLDAISQEAGFDQPEKLTYMMLSYVRIFGETTGSEFFPSD